MSLHHVDSHMLKSEIAVTATAAATSFCANPDLALLAVEEDVDEGFGDSCAVVEVDGDAGRTDS